MILKKIPKRTLPFRFREIKDVWGLLCSGSIEEGNFIKGFEEKFKDFVGAQETIALSSGRFGLYLILKNLGLKQGDGVLLSAYNFRGVPKALLQDGFIPVFVDADKKTYQISPEDIEKRISPNVKAIILTHLFGQPAEIDKINEGKLDKRDIETIVRGITNTTRVLNSGDHPNLTPGDVTQLSSVEAWNDKKIGKHFINK